MIIRYFFLSVLASFGLADAASSQSVCPSPVPPTITGSPYYIPGAPGADLWCFNNIGVPGSGLSIVPPVRLSLNATSSAPTFLTGAELQLVGLDGSISRMENRAYANAAIYSGIRADGTLAASTAVQAFDILSTFNGGGYDGTAYGYPSGSMEVYAAQNWSVGAHGAGLHWSYTPNGSTTIAVGETLDNAGNVEVGGISQVPVTAFLRTNLAVASIGTNIAGSLGILSSRTSSTTGGQTVFQRTRGSVDTTGTVTPTIVQTGDFIGGIGLEADDGTGLINLGNSIFWRASGTVAATSIPYETVFNFGSTAVPSVSTQGMKIDNGGNLLMGTGAGRLIADPAGELYDQTGVQSAPTTGTTVVMGDATDLYFIQPAGTLAALTVQLPTCSAGANGKRAGFGTTQTITALTITATAGTVVGAPATLALGQTLSFRCRGSVPQWTPSP